MYYNGMGVKLPEKNVIEVYGSINIISVEGEGRWVSNFQEKKHYVTLSGL